MPPCTSYCNHPLFVPPESKMTPLVSSCSILHFQNWPILALKACSRLPWNLRLSIHSTRLNGISKAAAGQFQRPKWNLLRSRFGFEIPCFVEGHGSAKKNAGTRACACRRGHVAKMGDMEAQVLVEFGTCLEVRASSGRSRIPLVHYPSKD